MAIHIKSASIIEAVGTKPKVIEEFIGAVNTGDRQISMARMKSPEGWQEPGQTPYFDEYTLVLAGALLVETKTESFKVEAGQVIIAPKKEWVRYSSPYPNGAEYVAVCLPAFSPNSVHRDTK